MKKINNIKLSFLSTLLIIIIVVLNSGGVVVEAEENTITDKDYISNIIISEENFSNDMVNIVEPYLNGIGQNGYFKGSNNADLYYEKYLVENSKGNIVICHGYSENLSRYREIIYYFTKEGYNVYGFEDRGHGRSTNLGKMDRSQIDVENFDYYIEDLKTFMDQIVNPEVGNEKKYLFSHSMGGTISTLFLEKYSGYFNAAILSSPMLEVSTGNVPSFIAKGIAAGAVLFGKGDKYVSGKGPYTGEYDFENTGTTSEIRYDYCYNLELNYEDFQKGGPSYRWLNEAFKATDKAIKKKNVVKINIPVLLFQARNDNYVNAGGQDKFVKYASNCRKIIVDNSKHEIFREKNEILIPYLNNILKFVEKN